MATLPPTDDWRVLLDLALSEDIGPGDLTSSLVIDSSGDSMVGCALGCTSGVQLVRLSLAAVRYRGVVPDLAPGAENAVNISLLLRLAEEFGENPPARPVLFAAFSGHFQALQGARVFADEIA